MVLIIIHTTTLETGIDQELIAPNFDIKFQILTKEKGKKVSKQQL